MELLCLVKKKKGVWHTVYNDVIICEKRFVLLFRMCTYPDNLFCCLISVHC